MNEQLPGLLTEGEVLWGQALEPVPYSGSLILTKTPFRFRYCTALQLPPMGPIGILDGYARVHLHHVVAMTPGNENGKKKGPRLRKT